MTTKRPGRRPTRKSIWDNFTPEQCVFIDQLMETMPGAVLRCTRQEAQLPFYHLPERFFFDRIATGRYFKGEVGRLVRKAFQEWSPPAAPLKSLNEMMKRIYRLRVADLVYESNPFLLMVPREQGCVGEFTDVTFVDAQRSK